MVGLASHSYTRQYKIGLTDQGSITQHIVELDPSFTQCTMGARFTILQNQLDASFAPTSRQNNHFVFYPTQHEARIVPTAFATLYYCLVN